MTRTKQRKPKGKHPKASADPAWEDIVKENALMEQYYKAQCIIPDEEWESFWTYCRKDLPSTFRITKVRGHENDMLHSLQDGYISKISAEDSHVSKDVPMETGTSNEKESEQDLLLEPIKWYPNNLAWNSNLSRRFLRRSEVLRKLHQFLVEDSECGAITRQEAVSMIPPMLLDVQPHHLVLDMCAAPGSKTAQLIEMMHDVEDDQLPSGAIVANDVDHKRCYLLTQQAKRLETHCVIVTNHDASIFPKVYSQNQDPTHAGELLEFDRVLCDVPCSGDGTIRKNPLLWTKWTPHLGISLHRVQMRILTRGLELLKVGGRLVYSTCSFNPIENEAVIAGVLSKCEDSIELVDCSNELHGLERRPGMITWKTFSKNGKEYENIEDVVDCKKIKESMFPPRDENAKALNLQHCMRIFPHLQNTGGFFIAVLCKKKELPWQKAKRGRFSSKILPWEGLGQKENNTGSESTAIAADTIGSVAASDGNEKNITDSDKVTVITNSIDSSKDALPFDIGGIDASIKDEENKTNKNKESDGSPPKKKSKKEMIKENTYIFLDDLDQELAEFRSYYKVSAELPSHQFLIRGDQWKRRNIFLVSSSVHRIISINRHLKIINTGLPVVSRSQFNAGGSESGLFHKLAQAGVHLMSRYIKERIVLITYQDLITLIKSADTKIENIGASTREQLAILTMGYVLWHYSPQRSKENNELSADIWLCGYYGQAILQCMISKEEKKHYLRLLGVPIPTELQEVKNGQSFDGVNEKAETKDGGSTTDDGDPGETVIIEGASAKGAD